VCLWNLEHICISQVSIYEPNFICLCEIVFELWGGQKWLQMVRVTITHTCITHSATRCSWNSLNPVSLNLAWHTTAYLERLIENKVPNLKYLHNIIKGKIELKRSPLYCTQVQLLIIVIYRYKILLFIYL